MRLIDSDALIERLEPYKDKYGAEEFPYYMVHEAFIYEMGKEPTVDAVPVIRCTDCKYAEHEDDGDIMCTFWDFCDCNHHVLGNGYCDRAERKDDETD